jgi:hypothetical protein
MTMWTQALRALGWGHWKTMWTIFINKHDTSPLDAKMIVWHVRLIAKCKIIDDVSYKIIFKIFLC